MLKILLLKFFKKNCYGITSGLIELQYTALFLACILTMHGVKPT